ncbi:hypothetical protein [Streptomyces sp. NPDC057580]|uniref:hypothetical protein n=1 Tax=Streptomyces sp. NPDC057580 TaxID=3346173 RepID=UPI00368A3B6D
MTGEEFAEIESEYLDALRRTSAAQDRVAELRGPVLPLDGQSPPELSPELRKAESEAQQAYNTYIPIRERYWSIRWGWQSNKPQG